MKKAFILILALVMTLTAVSCGGGDGFLDDIFTDTAGASTDTAGASTDTAGASTDTAVEDSASDEGETVTDTDTDSVEMTEAPSADTSSREDDVIVPGDNSDDLLGEWEVKSESDSHIYEYTFKDDGTVFVRNITSGTNISFEMSYTLEGNKLQLFESDETPDDSYFILDMEEDHSYTAYGFDGDDEYKAFTMKKIG